MPETRVPRWAVIERIYHDALARPDAERIDFVIQSCGDDAALRREVESLLRYEPLAETFLEQPALADLGSELPRDRSIELTGRRLGDYEVLGLLGSGGMGEVYTARDLKLGREVALKILTKTISADPAHVRRFEEEARSASVLNHPNIVTIYGVGEHEDIAYIAMEVVRGRTLRQVMAEGAVALDSAFEIILQLAAALGAAHGAGIVHRDLKPENIMLTTDGLLKVLDFGIARRFQLPEAEAGGSTRAEARTGLTEAGTILGTVGYMSPEQALGKLAGFPADQFAFGAIVYELLSGRRAFQRDSKVATISAIVESEPAPIDQFAPDVPEALRRVLSRCLAKSPDDRFADTRDLETEVRKIETIGDAERLSSRRRC